MSVRAARLLLLLTLVGGWELATRAGWVNPFFFSRPTAILSRIYEWTASGSLWKHLYLTMMETVWAFVIGVVTGVIAGYLLARNKWWADVLQPFIDTLNALPRVILGPVFVLWFGLGPLSKIALGVTLVFFVVFFNTFMGIRDVDRIFVDNARIMGASKRALAIHVYFPAALTWIFSSLRTSVGFALVGTVIGEFLGASAGMGYLIAYAQSMLDPDGVFAGLVLLSVAVAIINGILGRVEQRFLRWKPQSA
jgi:NitT/TauT family transport system permease protein